VVVAQSAVEYGPDRADRITARQQRPQRQLERRPILLKMAIETILVLGRGCFLTSTGRGVASAPVRVFEGHRSRRLRLELGLASAVSGPPL
jgi:hypothetical protein